MSTTARRVGRACAIGFGLVLPVVAPASIATSSTTAPRSVVARAERVGLETPHVIRLSGSDSDLGTVSVTCIDEGDQRPEVRFVRSADPEPGRLEVASMDLRDVLAPDFIESDTDRDVIDREAVRIWEFPSSTNGPPGRYDLRLFLFVFSTDASSSGFQPIGSADYQIDVTCGVSSG